MPTALRAIGLGAALLGLAACASGSANRRPTPGSDRQPGTASLEATTAGELDRILAGTQRSETNRARDAYRHPKETLLFFGIRPDMRVVEVWPADGWYTEVIAPLVNAHGKYYAAQPPVAPHSIYQSQSMQRFRDKLAARPELYGGVEITAFGPGGADIAPPGSIDLIVTFRNIHNWMAQGWAAQAFATLYRALKPGGVLGVVEHRGKPGVAQDPQAKSGYVGEDYAVQLIESQGFHLVARSEVNANPKDIKDYEQGVWTLPPTYRLGDHDREIYAAIGESDRFTLKFVKPR